MAGRLVQESNNLKRSRFLFLQPIHYGRNRPRRVNYPIDQENVTPLEGHRHSAADHDVLFSGYTLAIGGRRDEFELGRHAQPAHQVGQKDDTPLEDSDQNDGLALVVVVDSFGQFGDDLLDFSLVEK